MTIAPHLSPGIASGANSYSVVHPHRSGFRQRARAVGCGVGMGMLACVLLCSVVAAVGYLHAPLSTGTEAPHTPLAATLTAVAPTALATVPLASDPCAGPAQPPWQPVQGELATDLIVTNANGAAAVSGCVQFAGCASAPYPCAAAAAVSPLVCANSSRAGGYFSISVPAGGSVVVHCVLDTRGWVSPPVSLPTGTFNGTFAGPFLSGPVSYNNPQPFLPGD